MTNVVQFKKPKLKDKHKGKTLCKNGFHKWEVVTKSKFDVKQGKLVSVYKCSRCGVTKNKLT